jgi:hypothetical protein
LRGDTGIVANLKEHSVALIHGQHLNPAALCVGDHGANLHAAEHTALFADAIGIFAAIGMLSPD